MTTAAPVTQKRSLGVIHTVTALAPIFDQLILRHLPDWKPFSIVDESLLRNTIASGELSLTTIRRFAGYVWSAVDAGAEAILVTCSSIGPAADQVAHLCPVPLVRVDVGMVDKALDTGRRIAVLATLSTTLEPTAALVRTQAMKRGGPELRLTTHLCEGAFAMLQAGDRPGHDRRIVTAVREIADDVDVIILAQASMAGAVDENLRQSLPVPLLSSPELGILNLKRRLSTMDDARGHT